MTHAFISYNRRDTAFVERLERDLNQRGILTWRDQHSIVGGEEWFRAIKAGLQASYAVVYVDTPAAEESKWVTKEYLYAELLRLPIIPVRLDETFVSLQTINLNPILCDDGRYDLGVAKVAAVLNGLDKTPPVIPTAPASGRPQDELDYLQWVLLQAKADLRDARYVTLLATPERPAPQPEPPASPFGIGLDEDFEFERLGVEKVRGDQFDQPGEDVPDARAALLDLKRALLLGDPGSGKSTTLLQVLVDMARAAQKDPAARLPVFVPLANFSGATSFADFIRAQMYTLQSAYDRLLADGRLVLLCDALNEMPRRAPDGRDLLDEVRAYLRDQPLWAVSCRVRDYQDDLKDLPTVGKVRLKPLDPPRIRDFVRRRFHETPARGETLWAEMKGSDDLLAEWHKLKANGRADDFWQPEKWRYRAIMHALHADPRKLMALCRSPYLLTMVCRLYDLSGALPANRGALFADFVDNLLRREERACQRTGAPWLDADAIRAGLAQIAFALGGQTLISRVDAEALIQTQAPGTDASLLLRLAASASLIELGEALRFSHQLVQEYFAALYLDSQRRAGVSAATFWKQEQWWKPSAWDEATVILAGLYSDDCTPVLDWLADAQPELTARCVLESGAQTPPPTLNTLRSRWLPRLTDLKREPRPVARAAVGRALGLLDLDNRPGVGVVFSPLPLGEGPGVRAIPDIAWSDPIPPGVYPIGLASEEDNPARQLELTYSYRIAKYPITYVQFQTFLDDPEGYRDKDRWFAGLAADDDGREMWDQYFKYANHPRDSVNWYQALAFCRWLSWRLGGGCDLDDIGAWAVRLPTEQEWEIAARGKDGREYPYEGGFDAGKGNTRETGIGQTSAVGIFPNGASPYGVLDMSGNVWEWCLTAYNKPAPDAAKENLRSSARRVLRGGSWSLDHDVARAACRNWNFPLNRHDLTGFRVVWGGPFAFDH